MTTSKTIARLIGPTLLVIAAGVLVRLGSFQAVADRLSREPALVFLSGVLLFVAGLAIVSAHNIWAGGWPVLVTVLGWLAILGGLLRLLLPTWFGAVGTGLGQSTGLLALIGVVLLVVGAFLSYKGYSRD